MSVYDIISEQFRTCPQLSHASNILVKHNGPLKAGEETALLNIANHYIEYLQGVLAIQGFDNDTINKKTDLLNGYYNFMHDNNYDDLFTSQSKFRPTILEEFLFLLFKDLVQHYKAEYNDTGNVLTSGSVKAYTNLYFKSKDLLDFITSPAIGINQKDQDYAIFRTFDISINGEQPKKIQIPAVAIEAKTYIDKTMLDSIIATAEKLKSGNPHTRFIAVAERYDVSFDVDPAYSRIDQIYILRKSMRKNNWENIDNDVVLRLFKETKEHLERPWSDVKTRLSNEGVII